MKEKYDLGSLIELFQKHAAQYEEFRQSARKDFEKDNADKPLPEFLAGGFCISAALGHICQEILDIKKFLCPGIFRMGQKDSH